MNNVQMFHPSDLSFSSIRNFSLDQVIKQLKKRIYKDLASKVRHGGIKPGGQTRTNAIIQKCDDNVVCEAQFQFRMRTISSIP